MTGRRIAAALFLADRVGEVFDALVTGVNDRGVWVRLHRPAVEARLVAGTRGLDVGECVRVRLDRKATVVMGRVIGGLNPKVVTGLIELLSTTPSRQASRSGQQAKSPSHAARVWLGMTKKIA